MNSLSGHVPCSDSSSSRRRFTRRISFGGVCVAFLDVFAVLCADVRHSDRREALLCFGLRSAVPAFDLLGQERAVLGSRLGRIMRPEIEVRPVERDDSMAADVVAAIRNNFLGSTHGVKLHRWGF
jgi:hypothetical protein